MPLYYQDLALETAVYIYNITPHTNLNFISPYEKVNNRKPVTKNIKIWGSITYFLIKQPDLTKLEPKAILGILVGFN